MGLTHSRRNYAADGCFFVPKHTGKQGGLTDFGVDLIQNACDLGIVIDVSHLNDTGFWDVINHADCPIIASHSNCRLLCDNPRNLTDEQIKAIAERRGVVAVTSVPMFVDKKIENADVSRIINHIDHIIDIASVESVALGFDFYEYGMKYLSEEEKMRLPPELRTFLPTNIIKDEDVPNLIDELTRHGYCEKDMRLILGENLLRVFDEVWTS
jgi:membrane dipeptidase